eukprot:4752875-Amphidinium_carterae.2
MSKGYDGKSLDQKHFFPKENLRMALFRFLADWPSQTLATIHDVAKGPPVPWYSPFLVESSHGCLENDTMAVL